MVLASGVPQSANGSELQRHKWSFCRAFAHNLMLIRRDRTKLHYLVHFFALRPR